MRVNPCCVLCLLNALSSDVTERALHPHSLHLLPSDTVNHVNPAFVSVSQVEDQMHHFKWDVPSRSWLPEGLPTLMPIQTNPPTILTLLLPLSQVKDQMHHFKWDVPSRSWLPEGLPTRNYYISTCKITDCSCS